MANGTGWVAGLYLLHCTGLRVLHHAVYEMSSNLTFCRHMDAQGNQ